MKNILLLIGITYCIISNAQNQWNAISGIPLSNGNQSRAFAASYSVNNQYGLVVGGVSGGIGQGGSGSGSDNPNNFLYDTWRYDQSNGLWTQMADLPGGGRAFAAAMTQFQTPSNYFCIIGNGVVTTTNGGNFTMAGSNTFYRFNFGANTWALLPNNTTSYMPRFGSFGVCVNNTLYFGGGVTISGIFDNTKLYNYPDMVDDWYRYDSYTYLGVTYFYWTRIGAIPLGRRTYSSTFATTNQAYVGLGIQRVGSSNNFPSDFWRFDVNPSNGQERWTQMANFPGIGRNWAVAFPAYQNGNIIGVMGSSLPYDLYKYNTINDAWCQIRNLPAISNRTGSISFGIGNFGYVGAGYYNNSGSSYNVYSDFYSYDPTVELTLSFSGTSLCQNSLYNTTITTGCVYGMADYTVQISDASGNFPLPNTIIGMLSTSLSGNLIVPVSVTGAFPTGTNYKLRATSSNPNVLSNTLGGITILQAPPDPDTISGLGSICTNTNNVYSSTPNSCYNINNWTSYPSPPYLNTTPSGYPAPCYYPVQGSVSLNPGTYTGIITISLTSTNNNNGCKSVLRTKQIVVNNSVPPKPTITGTTNLCQTVTYTYQVASVLGNMYNWSINGFASFTSSGNVMYLTPTASGINTISIVVRSINGCGTTTSDIFSTPEFEFPIIPTSITGPPSVCVGTTALFSSSPNYGYMMNNWSIGAPYAITPNSSGSTVPAGLPIYATVTLQASTVLGSATLSLFRNNVANTACRTPTITTTSLIINATSAAPTISGSNQLCLNQLNTYTVATLAGVWNNWSISGNALITANGNNLTVLPTATGVINIVARNINGCGTVAGVVFSGTINNTGVVSSITGKTFICAGSPRIYTVSSLPGVSYIWTVAGSATYTAAANRLTVTGTNAGNLTISVNGIGCASNTVALNVTVGQGLCCHEYGSNISSIPSVLGLGSTMPTLNAGGGVLTLDGIYHVIGNLTVTNGGVWLKPGSVMYFDGFKEMDIMGGANVTITSATLTAACDTMWQGAYIYNLGSLSAIKTTGDSSELSHMYTGVQLLSQNAILRLDQARLLNNGYRSVYLDGATNYVGTTDNYFDPSNKIINSRFESDSTYMRYPFKHKYSQCHIEYEWLWYSTIRIAKNRFIRAIEGMGYFGPGHLSLGDIHVDTNYFDCMNNSITIAQYLQSRGNTYVISGRRAYVPGQYNDSIPNNGINLYKSCQFLISENDRFVSDFTPATKQRAGRTEGIQIKTIGDARIVNARFERLGIGIYINREAPSANGSAITISPNPMTITGNTFLDCVDGFRKDDWMFPTTAPGYPAGLYSFNDKPIWISCNGFTNGVRGISLFGISGANGDAKMYLSSTSGVMANKFTNVTNQIYSANTNTGLNWTYLGASDGGSSGTAFGSGTGTVTITLTSTLLANCGTSNPGARKDEENGNVTVQDIKVYPNPFNEALTVEFTSDIDNIYELELINTLGMTVYNYTLKATDIASKVTINSALPEGIYLVKLKSGNTLKIVKVLKNR